MTERAKHWYWGIAVALVMIGGIGYFLGPVWLRTGDDASPRNFVAVNKRLATAGQPSAQQLADLANQGYTLVVNLAPPQGYGAIADEGYRVAGAGLSYVNIPVDFERPRPDDFELFQRVLSARRSGKVLVHCQLNYRASAFVFLYRVIVERVAPFEAAEAMWQVWRPNAVWKEFMNRELHQRRIAFGW